MFLLCALCYCHPKSLQSTAQAEALAKGKKGVRTNPYRQLVCQPWPAYGKSLRFQIEFDFRDTSSPQALAWIFKSILVCLTLKTTRRKT